MTSGLESSSDDISITSELCWALKRCHVLDVNKCRALGADRKHVEETSIGGVLRSTVTSKADSLLHLARLRKIKLQCALQLRVFFNACGASAASKCVFGQDINSGKHF